MTGKARMSAYKDRIAETERVRGKELELSEVQEMCLWNRGMRSRYIQEDMHRGENPR